MPMLSRECAHSRQLCLPSVPLLPGLQRLAALTADAGAAEAYLAPRHVVDVLRDFRLPAGATLGPAELLGTLRQLQPRLYSISSSQVGGRPAAGCLSECLLACRCADPAQTQWSQARSTRQAGRRQQLST